MTEIWLKVTLNTINWNESTFSAMKYMIAAITAMDNGLGFSAIIFQSTIFLQARRFFVAKINFFLSE